MPTSTSTPYEASVILVAHNSRQHLERCLPPLLTSLNPASEVILVDNASTDGSFEYVRSDFPGVILLRSLRNLGYGSANNLAARIACGRFLAFLNPDTLIQPGWLEALLDALRSDRNAGLATPAILLFRSPHVLNACGNSLHLSGLTQCRGLGKPVAAFPSLERVAAVSGAAFAIPRDLFLHFGGFDESFFLYMEDTDLSLRLRLAGFHTLYVPTSVVAHDYRLALTPQKIYFLERNRYRMMLKCLRWSTLLLMLPVFLLAEIAAWGYVLACDRGLWRGKVSAYASIIRSWPEILKNRQEVQRTRCVSDAVLLQIMSPHLDFKQTSNGWAVVLADHLVNPMFRALHRSLVAIIRDP